jgi:glutathione S-transferase
MGRNGSRAAVQTSAPENRFNHPTATRVRRREISRQAGRIRLRRSPQGGTQGADDLAVNPNAKVPALVDGARTLREADAIVCHLAQRAGSDLRPQDARQIDAVRWLSWNGQHLYRHGGGNAALRRTHINATGGVSQRPALDAQLNETAAWRDPFPQQPGLQN